jgi:hypothetical protein
MPADNELDPLDRWLNQQVRPLPPPSGTFELITRRARRRKIRKAVVSVASAAAVVAAIAIAVPVGLSLHLGPSPAKGSLAAGSSTAPSGSRTPSTLGSGTKEASGSPSASTASPTTPTPATTASPLTQASGPVPANFTPTSVTFVNTSIGWVIGQAGTPGTCANKDPYICTSIARTDNAGQTWEGGPAPDTGAPSNATGVSGIRFLDGVNGWAFGPELWVTHDAGHSWHQENTDGARVTDLETVDGRAYALFGTCSNLDTADPGVDWAYCTSYTLMTTAADSNEWTPVSGATNGLTDGGAPTSGYIALYGTTGYLVAPDGTLYSGPIGGAWTKAGTIPCQPGNANYQTGQAGAQLATISSTQLATYCPGGHAPNSPSKVYTSDDGGALWTALSAQWPAGSTQSEGHGDSIAATSDGTIVLGTIYGIAVLPAGATTWQVATINGSKAANVDGLMENGGFSYVGMTSPTQGVAISDDSAVHEIWLTFDGGLTWTPSAITGG